MPHCTHLTVDYNGSIENDEIYDYSREGCNAGKRINLQITKKSARRPRRADHHGPRNSTRGGDALG